MNRIIKKYCRKITKRVKNMDLFTKALLISLALHGTGYLYYYIVTHSGDMSGDNIIADVEFMDFQKPIGATTDPPPREKIEEVEGSSKTAPDAPPENLDTNELSGEGSDADGYLYSYNGDILPSAKIDFNLRQYYPAEAKSANITEKIVFVQVQIDEFGKLRGAKIVSPKSGYGFDEQALKAVKRMRFSPGYINGSPVKMSHKLRLVFNLED